MTSGGRFIAGGGKLPEAWETGWGWAWAGAALAWGGELDGIFERAGTRPANKACKSTLLGSAAAAEEADGSAALAAVGAAGVEEKALESFKSGAGGD
jgi:hypothetical protein